MRRPAPNLGHCSHHAQP
ncbi:hypothetical protein VCHC41A1_2434, partial [Vibrio cholerae HC-41A1]